MQIGTTGLLRAEHDALVVANEVMELVLPTFLRRTRLASVLAQSSTSLWLIDRQVRFVGEQTPVAGNSELTLNACVLLGTTGMNWRLTRLLCSRLPSRWMNVTAAVIGRCFELCWTLVHVVLFGRARVAVPAWCLGIDFLSWCCWLSTQCAVLELGLGRQHGGRMLLLSLVLETGTRRWLWNLPRLLSASPPTRRAVPWFLKREFSAQFPTAPVRTIAGRLAALTVVPHVVHTPWKLRLLCRRV